ncbi:unnamed protein product, partial [Ectocarpus sp. 8 AP-2014]
TAELLLEGGGVRQVQSNRAVATEGKLRRYPMITKGGGSHDHTEMLAPPIKLVYLKTTQPQKISSADTNACVQEKLHETQTRQISSFLIQEKGMLKLNTLWRYEELLSHVSPGQHLIPAHKTLNLVGVYDNPSP